MLVLLFFVQGCPDVVDVPAAVEPNLDKLDLDRFLQDLPKYKPWLSAVAWEAWEEFHITTDELRVSRLNSWDLPNLYQMPSLLLKQGKDMWVHLSAMKRLRS